MLEKVAQRSAEKSPILRLTESTMTNQEIRKSAGGPMVLGRHHVGEMYTLTGKENLQEYCGNKMKET